MDLPMENVDEIADELNLTDEEIQNIISELPEDMDDQENKCVLAVPEIRSKVPELGFHSEGIITEFVSGVENEVQIEFENIGEIDFPGGLLTDIEFNTGFSGGIAFTEEIEIPEIGVGEKKVVSEDFRIYPEGQGGIRATIESYGEKEVEIKSSDENKLNEVFRAVPKERIQIISELKEINSNIK
jgi:hypothetical protein